MLYMELTGRNALGGSEHIAAIGIINDTVGHGHGASYIVRAYDRYGAIEREAEINNWPRDRQPTALLVAALQVLGLAE